MVALYHSLIAELKTLFIYDHQKQCCSRTLLHSAKIKHYRRQRMQQEIRIHISVFTKRIYYYIILFLCNNDYCMQNLLKKTGLYGQKPHISAINNKSNSNKILRKYRFKRHWTILHLHHGKSILWDGNV